MPILYLAIPLAMIPFESEIGCFFVILRLPILVLYRDGRTDSIHRARIAWRSKNGNPGSKGFISRNFQKCT